MARSYKPVDLSKLKTYSIRDRSHRASAAAMAALPKEGASAHEMLEALPDHLGAVAFRHVADFDPGRLLERPRINDALVRDQSVGAGV